MTLGSFPTLPPSDRNRWSGPIPIMLVVSVLIFALIMVLIVGVGIGYLLPRSGRGSDAAQLATALSKPLNVQVRIANSTSPPQVTPLFEALAGLVTDAVRGTDNGVKDTAVLASEAARRFVDELVGGMGGEIGKNLVDGFSELISSGFQPSKDKARDRQVITTILMGTFFPVTGGDNVAPTLSSRMEARIVFDINRAHLTSLANATIGKVRDFAVLNPGTIVLLTANADTLGSESRNHDLAAQRSKAVFERLVFAGGIAANRVFVANLGNAALPRITPPNTAEEQNRSVSIEVRE